MIFASFVSGSLVRTLPIRVPPKRLMRSLLILRLVIVVTAKLNERFLGVFCE